jgi:hypothetical protein
MGKTYFDQLYEAVKASDVAKLSELLGNQEERGSGSPKIWVDIKDPANITVTVAGKLAEEGCLEAVLYLCNAFNASWDYVIEGLVRGSLKQPELMKIALYLYEKHRVHPVVLARAYASIGKYKEAVDLFAEYFRAEGNRDLSFYIERNSARFVAQIGLGFLLGKKIEEFRRFRGEIRERVSLFDIVSSNVLIIECGEFAQTVGKIGNLDLINEFLTTNKTIQLHCIQGLAKGNHCATSTYQNIAEQAKALGASEDDISEKRAVGYIQAGNFQKILALKEESHSEKWHKGVYASLITNGYYEVANTLWPNITINSDVIAQLAQGGHIVYFSAVLNTLPANKEIKNSYNINWAHKGLYMGINAAAYHHFWHPQSAADFISRISNLDVKIREYYLGVAKQAFGGAARDRIVRQVGEVNNIRASLKLSYEAAAVLSQNIEIAMIMLGRLSSKQLGERLSRLESPLKGLIEGIIALPDDIKGEIISHFEELPIRPGVINALFKLTVRPLEEGNLSCGSSIDRKEENVSSSVGFFASPTQSEAAIVTPYAEAFSAAP